MSLVSIIIVSWNAREFLRGCLNSIAQSRGQSGDEVIVVDNASSDGSAEMVEREFPSVKLLRAGSNLGFAGANNLAMKYAQGDYFALVNSDALVYPGCLERLCEHLDLHPEIGLVGPRVVGGDGLLQRTCRKLPTLWNTLCRALALDRPLAGWSTFSGYEVPSAQHEQPHEPEVMSGCFCVARRRAVEQIGGLDERFFFYGEDIDWCKRFRDGGWKLAFVPAASAMHFGGGSTSKAPLRFSVEILRATLIYWHKHHGAMGRMACQTLLVLHHATRLALRSLRYLFRLSHPVDSGFKLKEDFVCLRWLVLRAEL
jgi:GT2 family glycosyltransferase